MADVRVQLPIKIVDPTTDANQAGVSAAGNLQVAVNLALPAGDNNIGNVDVLSVIPGTGATNLGKAEDDAHSSGDVGVMALGIRDDTLGVFSATEGDYEPFHMTATGRLYTSATIDAALPAGANNIGDVDVTSVVPGTGATNLGKVEDDGHATGDVGVQMLAVRNDTPVALAGTDLDYIPLSTDNLGRLRVTDPNAGAGSPTSPVVLADTAAAIAAGAEDTTIQTAELGGATRSLAGIDITSSVAFKAKIQEVLDGVATTKVVLFGASGQSIQWRPPHKDFFTTIFAANAGFDGWRCAMTNADPSEAADLYATFYTQS